MTRGGPRPFGALGEPQKIINNNDSAPTPREKTKDHVQRNADLFKQ